MKVQHLVVTRLAMKLFYEDFSQAWLDERVRLFRNYCVPGMARQTAGDYLWLVLCDETADRGFIEAIQESAETVPQLRVVPTSRERDVNIPDAVASVLDEDTDVLISTRLDSDDSFHADMLAVVQSYIDAFIRFPSRKLVLDFPLGYRYDEPNRRLYATYWMNSPFATLFEKLRPGGRFQNAYVNHHKLYLKGPVHSDVSFPGWIQLIHALADSTKERAGTALTGGNRTSTVQRLDIEVDPSEIGGGFAVDLGRSAPQPG
jgi:hypothetical protein